MRLTKPFHLELSRFWRRVLVVLLYALDAGLITFWALLPPPLSTSFTPFVQWVSLAVFALMVLTALVLYASTGGVSDIHDGDLYPNAKPPPVDERQEKVRNQAYLIAYLILGPSLLVLIPSAGQIAPIWLVTLGLLLYAVLPIAVLAWLEPDPLPDEEVEDAPHLLT